MKRECSERDFTKHAVFLSLFNLRWHYCECCKLDFRFESGWFYQTGPYYGGKGVVKYVCRKCKPVRSDVINFIKESTSCLM